ncbi:MAG TPA: hypothetical protein VHJ77_00180 [Vicinamibacterales bacterium]|nr:hypothetical protein [Vicinamibacterales bacterium]
MRRQGVFYGRGGALTTIAHSINQPGGDSSPSSSSPIITSCAEALNNLGQIVLTVQSENPDTFEVRSFIVRATPRLRE